MLQPEPGNNSKCGLAQEWYRVGEMVKRSFCSQYEVARESGLRQAEDHLNMAVKKGKIGQIPYNDEEKLKISNVFIQSLIERFRDVVASNFDSKIFENIIQKISKDDTTFASEVNTFEIDVDLAIALKLSESYRDIARPIVVLVLSEYQDAIQKGENEAKRKLKMTDEFELHSFVDIFRKEIKTKCEELGYEITEKMLEKIRANPDKRMVDQISRDRINNSALPIRAFEAASSLSSAQRNISATIDPEEYESNNAVQHRSAQFSTSSLAVSGQEDEINVATNNQTASECVSSTAVSLPLSKSIVEGNLPAQTVEATRSGKRPRLSVGSRRAFSDDGPENLRQIENLLCAHDSDESHEEGPPSRPSKSMKSKSTRSRDNYEDRVNDLLDQGIKVILSKSNIGLSASITLGSGRKLKFYFSNFLVPIAKLKHGEQIYIKLQLGLDYYYMTRKDILDEHGHGCGARLLLSKEKFEQLNGTYQVQKMNQFYIDPDRLECIRNIHEIVTARANSA